MTNLSLRGLIAAAGLAVALAAPGTASALNNGDPCSPFWTEDAAPTASFTADPAAVSTRQAVILDASTSMKGTADKWTWVSAASECQATSTVEDPIASFTWDFGDGSPPEHDPAPLTTTAHTFVKAGTYTVTLTATEQNCQAGPAAHCFTSRTRPGSTRRAGAAVGVTVAD